MLTVEKQEQIRRAYFIEEKSIRAICSDIHCAAKTVRKALASAEPVAYTLQTPRPAPVLGPYHERIAALLAENATLPAQTTLHRAPHLHPVAGGGLSGCGVHAAWLCGPVAGRTKATGGVLAAGI
jgi:hypothetical protein